MGKQKGQLLEKLKQMKKNQWAVIVLVGILLLVIAIPVNPGKEEVMPQTDVQKEKEGTQIQDYAESLERKLEQVLSRVEGVGEAKVMITLESSGEKVVEKDASFSDRSTAEEDSDGNTSNISEKEEGEETVYQSGSDGGQVPYVVEEKQPEIAGVIVVAEGGGQAVTANNITEAVMALFGVEAHKIKVMKMN